MKNKRFRTCLIVGLILGALADIWLRLTTGDEGNLLVHTVVFLGGTLIVAGAAYGISSLWLHFLKTK